MCDGGYTLCAARGKSIPGVSQSARVRCRSEKSPSFGLCQVDMYAFVLRVGIRADLSRNTMEAQKR